MNKDSLHTDNQFVASCFVALQLAKRIADTHHTGMTKEELLKTYAECFKTVRNGEYTTPNESE